MSTQDNEQFYNFILFAILLIATLAGVVYGAFCFWPYLIFYCLPLIIGSLSVGGVLRLATLPAEEASLIHYKGLITAYPMLILLVMAVFFAGSQRSYSVDKKGNIKGVFLDWPEANKTFNDYRSSTYAASPFDSLKARAKESVIYDRQEMGWLALWCLILGGPLFFWYLVRRDQERNAEIIGQMARERIRLERERVSEKERALNEIIADRLKEMRERIVRLESDKAATVAENQVLKAKVEFARDVPRPSEAAVSSGLLDKDIL